MVLGARAGGHDAVVAPCEIEICEMDICCPRHISISQGATIASYPYKPFLKRFFAAISPNGPNIGLNYALIPRVSLAVHYYYSRVLSSIFEYSCTILVSGYCSTLLSRGDTKFSTSYHQYGRVHAVP